MARKNRVIRLGQDRSKEIFAIFSQLRDTYEVPFFRNKQINKNSSKILKKEIGQGCPVRGTVLTTSHYILLKTIMQ